jgi:hypothetical protein
VPVLLLLIRWAVIQWAAAEWATQWAAIQWEASKNLSRFLHTLMYGTFSILFLIIKRLRRLSLHKLLHHRVVVIQWAEWEWVAAIRWAAAEWAAIQWAAWEHLLQGEAVAAEWEPPDLLAAAAADLSCKANTLLIV